MAGPSQKDLKDSGVGAAGAAPKRAQYERDFYSWLLEQAGHVRHARWAGIDRENLAVEIEALGEEQFSKLENTTLGLILHILKWDHQPSQRTRSRILAIQAQRLELEDMLSDSPGLKPRLAEAVARAYRKARVEIAQVTGLDVAEFPETCPCSLDDITSRALSL